ncbi:hypothetical protein BDZ89DRAFT_201003 [Hymenopellis radicata]|nr:hypothetical protein BDZ89DRAFT_201003 [Hymenopellis radicata]
MNRQTCNTLANQSRCLLLRCPHFLFQYLPNVGRALGICLLTRTASPFDTVALFLTISIFITSLLSSDVEHHVSEVAKRLLSKWIDDHVSGSQYRVPRDA